MTEVVWIFRLESMVAGEEARVDLLFEVVVRDDPQQIVWTRLKKRQVFVEIWGQKQVSIRVNRNGIEAPLAIRVPSFDLEFRV